MLPLPVPQPSFAVLTASGFGLAASERGLPLLLQFVSSRLLDPVLPEHRLVCDPLEPLAEQERVQRHLAGGDAPYAERVEERAPLVPELPDELKK